MKNIFFSLVAAVALVAALAGCGSLALSEAPASQPWEAHPECFARGEPALNLYGAARLAEKCEEEAYRGLGNPEKGLPDPSGAVLVRGAIWHEECLWHPGRGYRPWWLKEEWGYSFFAHPEQGWDPEIEPCGETAPAHR